MKKKDEIWEIEHVRKGKLTVRLDEDVADDQEWFSAELLEGKPSYIGNEVRIGFMGQRPPVSGESMTHRQSLVRWLRQVPMEEFVNKHGA